MQIQARVHAVTNLTTHRAETSFISDDFMVTFFNNDGNVLRFEHLSFEQAKQFDLGKTYIFELKGNNES